MLVHESQGNEALQLLKPSPSPKGHVGAVLGLQKSLTNSFHSINMYRVLALCPGNTAVNKTGNPACVELTFQEVLK